MSSTTLSPPPPPQPLPALESFIEVLPVPPLHDRRRGVVRFVGLTDFAPGEWVGVELVGSEGRNDGSVKGQSYFKCLPGQGVFVRPNLVVPYEPAKTTDVNSAPQPSLTTTADLEAQLAVLQQQAAESAAAQAKLSDALQSAKDELVRVKADAEARKATDDDDDFASQVRLEEERFALQKQLEAYQVELQAAIASSRTAQAAQAVAEARATSAQVAQQRSEDARAQLQAHADDLQKELAKVHADSTATVTTAQGEAVKKEESVMNALPQLQQQQQLQQPPSLNSTTTEQLESLRSELQRSKLETQQLRCVRDDLEVAKEMCRNELAEAKAHWAASEDRTRAVEKRLEDEQRKRRGEAEETNAAHAAILAGLRAELEALKGEKANLESRAAAELRATEERLTYERDAALRAHEAEAQKALAAMQHEKDELRELCQLLEDELKEEKSQSDELARLVENLGSEQASSQAAVDNAQQQTAGERDRLRREVEEARAREVHLMAAMEAAQQEKDAALRLVETERMSAAVPPDGQAAKNAAAAHLAVESASTSNEVSLASPVDDAAALERYRNELDEAHVRIMQLTSTQQVAQDLQQRCDELSRAGQHQRLEAQKRLDEAQNEAAAAAAKAMAEITLWKRQCAAAQRSAADLANVVAELQQQLGKDDAAESSVGRHKTFPLSLGSRLDAGRERRYEERIAALTRQLLEHQSARMSTVSAWPSFSAQRNSNVRTNDASSGLSRSPVKLLDFSSPEACKASVHSLFRAA